MYKKLFLFVALLSLLSSCSTAEPLTEEKFKNLHRTIYDAWELESKEEIKSLLETSLTGAFLEEQLASQYAMLQTRQESNEEHKVETITYHKLEITESSEADAVVYADYTIEGYRFHGDYHEQKSSHRIYWHLVLTEDGWKIDQIDT